MNLLFQGRAQDGLPGGKSDGKSPSRRGRATGTKDCKKWGKRCWQDFRL